MLKITMSIFWIALTILSIYLLGRPELYKVENVSMFFYHLNFLTFFLAPYNLVTVLNSKK